MIILALDTSSPTGSIGILKDERIAGCIATTSPEAYSSRMFRHLNFLLHELSMRLEDMDLYAVVAGPGSFTGLRVGLTAAKGWSEAYGKPIAAVSALEAVALQSRSSAENLVPVLDARRGEIYFAFYQRANSAGTMDLALQGEECSMSPDEFTTRLNDRSRFGRATIVTSTPEVLHAISSRIEIQAAGIERVSGILAPEIGQIGLRHSREGRVFDSLSLDANYVRRSDAEVHYQKASGS